MKCNNCKKHFNTHAFGETFCPYCGVKVDKESEKKIINREYLMSPKFWALWIIALFTALGLINLILKLIGY